MSDAIWFGVGTLFTVILVGIISWSIYDHRRGPTKYGEDPIKEGIDTQRAETLLLEAGEALKKVKYVSGTGGSSGG